MADAVDFHKHIVNEAPPVAYYIPDFIEEDEEESLLKAVYSAPKPKWTQLSNRRLQNWGGLPHPKGMIAETIPSWLNRYMLRLNDLRLFEEKKANHVLVNEYLPGQGIMPHLDGPLFYPTITTINLGSHTILDFYDLLDEENEEKQDSSLQSRYIGSFLLEQRSLVCFKKDLYARYMHGIEERKEDNMQEKVILNKDNLNDQGLLMKSNLERQTRVSLTIRHFPKTLNAKLKIGIGRR